MRRTRSRVVWPRRATTTTASTLYTDQQRIGHGQHGRGVDEDDVIAVLELPDRLEHRLRSQELTWIRRNGTRNQHVHRAGLAGLKGVRQLDGAGQDVDQALVLRRMEKRVDHGAAQVRIHQRNALSGAGARDGEVHRQRGLPLRGDRARDDDGLWRALLRGEREVCPYLSISLGACRTGMCLGRYRDPAHLEGHDAERRQPGCRLDISGVLEAPVEGLHHERRRDTEHETEREPDDQVLRGLGEAGFVGRLAAWSMSISWGVVVGCSSCCRTLGSTIRNAFATA